MRPFGGTHRLLGFQRLVFAAAISRITVSQRLAQTLASSSPSPAVGGRAILIITFFIVRLSEKEHYCRPPGAPGLWRHRGDLLSALQAKANLGWSHSMVVRFGIGFKKNNQFFPIVLQKITDCSDYCPFVIETSMGGE